MNAQKIQKQEKILLSLGRLNFATRDQLQKIEDLKGDRNAHRILFEMEKDKLINSVRYDKKIYYLSSRGGERIGTSNIRLKRNQIKHNLMRNDLYIKLNTPESWQKEAPVIINGKTVLISDARYKNQGKYVFVEIDNKQSMRANYDKIKKYKEVFKMMFRQYKYHPTLLWYTLSDIRKIRLESACVKEGIKYEINPMSVGK